jgi:hypothetical protein
VIRRELVASGKASAKAAESPGSEDPDHSIRANDVESLKPASSEAGIFCEVA